MFTEEFVGFEFGRIGLKTEVRIGREWKRVIIDSERPTDGLRGEMSSLYLPRMEGFDGTTLMKTSCSNGNPKKTW
jgi:hypothetical protein